MNLESSSFSIIVSLLAAILVSIAFYYKDKKLKETASGLKFILISCRFFIVFILVFLLFKPLTNHVKEEVRSSVFPVLIDNSNSIILSDSTLKSGISDFKKKLKQTFSQVDLNVIPFSNDLQVGDSLVFSNQGTNISSAIEELKSLFPLNNIGSALIISDGIITEGTDDFSLGQTPIFVLGVGDTIKHPDASIKKVFHNDISFLGNEFEVEINLKFKEFFNQKQVVQVIFGGEVIKEKTIVPSSHSSFEKFKVKIKANKSGEIPIRVEVKNTFDEKNKVNNSKTSFIKVKEKKLNLLLVYDAPHPDVRLVKSAFFGLDHVKLSSVKYSDLDYDLTNTSVVFFLGNNSVVNQRKWLDKINQRKIGFVWLTGVNGMFDNEFFTLQKLDNTHDDVICRLDKNFSKFRIKGEIENCFDFDLPISVPFGKWQIKGESEVFCNQTVNGVETNLPLIYFNQNRGVQYCLMFGEGYWRLGFKNKEGMHQFLRKAIDVVAVKVDDSSFQLFSMNELTDSEDVIIRAKYWNQAGELDNVEEVQYSLYSGDSLVLKSKFLKSLDNYYVNLGKQKEGVYRLAASLKKGTEVLNKSTTFVIKTLRIESENLVADHNYLKQIAATNNGQFYPWENKGDLIEALKSSNNFKSISYFESISNLLIKHKWVLFLLLGLISIEWFIRKWQGTI